MTVRRQYAEAAFGQVGQAMLGLASIALLARLLSAPDLGRFTVLTVAATVAATVITSGFTGSSVIAAAQRPAWRSQLAALGLTVALPLAGAGAMVFAIAGPIVDPSMADGASAPLLAAMGARVGLIALALTGAAVTNGAGRIDISARLGVLNAAANLFGPLGAIARPDAPLSGAGIGLFVGSCILALAGVAQVHAAVGFERPSRSAVVAMARTAAPLQVGTTAYWLLLRADTFVLAAVAGPAAVATYAIAQGIAERVALVGGPLYTATAYRIAGGGSVAMDTLRSVLRGQTVIALAVAILGTILAPLAVAVVGGGNYQGAEPVVGILILAAAVLPAWGSVGLFIASNIRGGLWTTARIQIGVALIGVASYVAAIRTLGIMGAAIVSVAAYALLLGIGLMVIRRSARDLGRSETQAQS